MPEIKLTPEIARRNNERLKRALSGPGGPIFLSFRSEEEEREMYAKWDAESEAIRAAEKESGCIDG